MSGWLTDRLAWVVAALLVLWLPPVILAIAVDLGWAAGPWPEYPALTDPALILDGVQLGLMAAALAGLPSKRAWAWTLLGAAWAAWGLHAAWTLQFRLRLNGVSTFRAPDALLTLGGLAVAAVVLARVRPRFAPGLPSRVP